MISFQVSIICHRIRSGQYSVISAQSCIYILVWSHFQAFFLTFGHFIRLVLKVLDLIGRGSVLLWRDWWIRYYYLEISAKSSGMWLAFHFNKVHGSQCWTPFIHPSIWGSWGTHCQFIAQSDVDSPDQSTNAFSRSIHPAKFNYFKKTE